jgi:hypothetical protein
VSPAAAALTVDLTALVETGMVESERSNWIWFLLGSRRTGSGEWLKVAQSGRKTKSRNEGTRMFPWSDEASVREGWIFVSLDAVGRQVGQDLGYGKRLRFGKVGILFLWTQSVVV